MGIFDRVERGLERAVKAPFAKVFKAEVQPVEIAAAMRGAMDDRAAVLGPGRTMVPNVFTVELARTDFERLSSFDTALTDELVAAVEDHADAQRYTPAGTVEVRLTTEDDLETGIFRVRPASRGSRKSSPPPNRATAPPPRRPARQDGVDISAFERPRTQSMPAARPAPRPEPRREPSGPTLEINGSRRRLTAAVTTIGRDVSADITIDDPGVSRRHAEIRISHDGPHLQVFVRDLGSTNGTYLNGDQVGHEELREGDRLTVGRTTITVSLDSNR